MSLPELLAPAGSFEGVRAAVQSGATAVYMGFGTFNARRGAKGFTPEEMAAAIAYCRARGVKTNITLNILIGDREREAALRDARFLYEAGADALIVQDLGLARLLRQAAPALELHASTQLTVSTLDGARYAKERGFSRVVLSRETPLAEIERITAGAGVETEVFAHGALCMCWSGQCYLSSVIGQRSGNRGLCAQPCRLPYRYEGARPTYPLSLRDLSLAHHVRALCAAGVSSLKLEGRMKRPEYTAVVAGVYADLLREQRRPTREEDEALRRVFSREGFTDGYLTGKKGDAMFGTKTDLPLHEVQALYDEAARRFAEGKERPLVPVRLHLTAGQSGLRLTARDESGACVAVTDDAPVEAAQNRPATPESVRKSLEKTGGTPFYLAALDCTLEEGLLLPASRLNALRREALAVLLAQRETPPSRPAWTQPALTAPAKERRPLRGFTVEVRSLTQLTDALLDTAPAAVYVPLTELSAHEARVRALAQRVTVAAVLPRVFFDGEQEELVRQLRAVKAWGVHVGVAGNVGHLPLLAREGFTVWGDFGLNAFNSDTLAVLAESGVERQTLSFELRLSQLRDLAAPMETELIAYGLLPLMVFENCAIRRRTGKCTCKRGVTTLTDRTGNRFPLLPEFGCRNTLLNSRPLVLPPEELAGADFARLRFTLEEPERCAAVARAYAEGRTPETPEGSTRGLYRRGVE